jgi:2-hydroxychromene-2-carboxylate isomerase
MGMVTPIEFWFDFSSPYAYLAATRIDAIAARHGRSVAWKPFLLGVAFKANNTAPLTESPMKGPYSKHDFARTARLFGVPLKLPEPFPFLALVPSRAFYWLHDQDPARAVGFAQAVFREAFVAGRVVAGAEATAAVAAPLGIDRAALLAALNEPAVKDRLRAEVEAGLAKGVFGSPFVIVDGEPFWGADRLEQVERWMATGGW